MKTSAKGLALIKSFEGCRLVAYPDPATGGDPWTIGYGTTDGVRPGMTITQQEAENLLRKDLDKFEKGVAELVKVDITQSMFDALVSFSYNVGLANLKSSTLLRMVNARDFQGAAQQFVRWNRAAGKVMNGLTRRRLAESDLFLER